MNPWDLTYRPVKQQVAHIASDDQIQIDYIKETEDSSSSLATQDAVNDRKARKKDQNRRAAYNYRRKKMEEKNRMREEEMRLVYSRVLLIGYAEKLEGSINFILTANSKKMIQSDGNSVYFSCPICQQSCDNINNLRSHLRLIHHSNS